MTDAVDQLYTLAPEEFIAARDALAKAGPPHEKIRIKAMRRPTVGAWLVNQLVRARRESTEQLIALGADLRRAQQTGRADVLRSLGAVRRALTDELVAAAAEVATAAGRVASADLLAAVASSLDAAVADSGLAAQLRSATLTEPLAYAGFGAFALSTVADLAPDLPTAGMRQETAGTVNRAIIGTEDEPAAPRRTGPTSRERAAAERERLAVEKAAASDRKRLEEATATLTAAREQRRSAEDLLRLSEHALSDARMGLDLARRAEQKAQDALDALPR